MRRMWSLVPVSLAAVSLLAAVTVDRAQGTTGSTGLPHPKEVVARAVGDKFTGRYLLTSVDKRAKIISGELMVDWTHTEKPFLLGFLLLFKYDKDGRQSSFVANAYPFSFAKGRLSAVISAQGSGDGLGRLALRLPTEPDEQSGTLALNGGTAYAVTYRRRDESASPTATLAPAEQTAGGAPVKLTHSGLGPKDAAAYGRYRLVPGDAQAGENAGVYAPVLRLASHLSGDGRAPDSGSLTLFGNVVKKGAPPVPAGIVTLHRPASTDVAYLTDFKWGGDRRSATIRGGSTDGPEVGTFAGSADGDEVNGTLVEGRRRTDVRFVRQP
jgi:hypothetical protein